MGDLTILMESAKAELDRRIAAVRVLLGGGTMPGPHALRAVIPAGRTPCGVKVHSTKRRAYRRRKAA